MSGRERKAITQRTGALVSVHGRDLRGIVTGHYDDDLVYVDFGKGPERVPVKRLVLIAPAPDGRRRS